MSETPGKEGGYIGGVPMYIFEREPGSELKVTLKSGLTVDISMDSCFVRIRGYDRQERPVFFYVGVDFFDPEVLKLDIQTLIAGSKDFDDIGSADIKLLVEKAIAYIEKHNTKLGEIFWIEDTTTLNT